MTRDSRKRRAAPPAPSGAPSPERLQHDRVTLAERQIADARGEIGLPYIAEGPIARLYRQGRIGAREFDAAIEFRRLYRLAYLDPLRASTLGERVIGAHLPHGSEAARRCVGAVLQALGSRSGSLQSSCAASVIGSEMSVAEWARGKRWRGQQAISEHVAKGVLLTTLEALAPLLDGTAKKMG